MKSKSYIPYDIEAGGTIDKNLTSDEKNIISGFKRLNPVERNLFIQTLDNKKLKNLHIDHATNKIFIKENTLSTLP